MPTPLRRRLRHGRRFVGYGVLVVLVLVALLVGIANQLLPLAERNPQRIAAWLSERAGRPVHFARVESEWTRRGPVLRLDDLRIGEGASSFLVGDTEMLVSLYAGLLPGRTFTELRLRGLDITVQRDDDGQWHVRGLPGQQPRTEGDPFAALERLGELQIIGGRLHLVAPTLGIDATVPRIDLRLRVEGDRVRSGMRAWMQAKGVPLRVIGILGSKGQTPFGTDQDDVIMAPFTTAEVATSSWVVMAPITRLLPRLSMPFSSATRDRSTAWRPPAPTPAKPAR